MARIICVVAPTMPFKQRLQILQIFTNNGFLNFAIVHKTESNDIVYEIFVSITGKGKRFINPTDFHQIFPDKLINMDGYSYQIVAYHQPPFVQLDNNEVKSHMGGFLQALSQVQNSKIQVNFLRDSTLVSKYWIERKMHLTLNTATKVDSPLPKLHTFEKKSYCALVPVPPKSSFFRLIIVMPFDLLTWMFFGMSVVSAVAVWRAYRGHGAVDSHLQLAAGIFMIFIGQDANFSRRNRFVLAVLLNIICVSMFVLSNLYESTITSFMIEPVTQDKLKSVKDLLASDYKLMTSSAFEFKVKNNEKFQLVKSKTNSSGYLMRSRDEANLIQMDYAFVKICETAENILTKRLSNGKLLTDYYYLLPEKLTWQYVELEASYLNPFLERFQYYMDLCFQAGLPQSWKIYTFQNYAYKTKTKSEVLKNYLELEDLAAIFAIYLIFCAVSIATFLCEIFYHDCLMYVEVRSIVCRFFGNLRENILRKRRKMKLQVRKVIVKPIKKM